MDAAEPTLTDGDLAALAGCCYEGAKGRCGSHKFGSNPRPQSSLYRLYRDYHASERRTPPLDALAFTPLLAQIMDTAGVKAEDRFCAEHSFEIDTRLRYELVQASAEPDMGAWLHGAAADETVRERPLVSDLGEARNLDVDELVRDYDSPEL